VVHFCWLEATQTVPEGKNISIRRTKSDQ